MGQPLVWGNPHCFGCLGLGWFDFVTWLCHLWIWCSSIHSSIVLGAALLQYTAIVSSTPNCTLSKGFTRSQRNLKLLVMLAIEKLKGAMQLRKTMTPHLFVCKDFGLAFCIFLRLVRLHIGVLTLFRTIAISSWAAWKRSLLRRRQSQSVVLGADPIFARELLLSCYWVTTAGWSWMILDDFGAGDDLVKDFGSLPIMSFWRRIQAEHYKEFAAWQQT